MQSKAQLIAGIREDQHFWRSLAAEVRPDRYSDPGPMGEWTFGDMAGHLLGWRQRTIRRIEAAADGAPEPANPWPADLDDDDIINDWIHDQHAGRPPEELVAAYDASYDRLASALERIPEQRLTDPGAFPWAGGALAAATFTDHRPRRARPGGSCLAGHVEVVAGLHERFVRRIRTDWLDCRRVRSVRCAPCPDMPIGWGREP